MFFLLHCCHEINKTLWGIVWAKFGNQNIFFAILIWYIYIYIFFFWFYLQIVITTQAHAFWLLINQEFQKTTGETSALFDKEIYHLGRFESTVESLVSAFYMLTLQSGNFSLKAFTLSCETLKQSVMSSVSKKGSESPISNSCSPSLTMSVKLISKYHKQSR